MIYFDNSATACAPYKNPSSLHKLGFNAKIEIENCRKKLRKALNVSEGEIIFTSCSTESNNTAIFSAIKNNFQDAGAIYFTDVNCGENIYYNEHKSISMPLKHLKEKGVTVHALNEFKETLPLNAKTKLLTLSHVSSDYGVMTMPQIEDYSNQIKDFCSKNENSKIYFLLDATQSFLKLDIDLTKLAQVDFLTISSHKIGGMSGVSALFIRNPKTFTPLLFGGGQEFNLRSGTENVQAILDFGNQLDTLDIKQNYEHVKKIKEHICMRLKIKDSTGFPYILTIKQTKFPPEVLLNMLSEKEIFVSTGSACAKESKYKDIRLSFSHLNTLDEANTFCDVYLDLIGE